MITYPINNVQSVSDYQTGRVLVIADPTAFTPAVFYKFINEGFIPIGVLEDEGVINYSFCAYSVFTDDAETYVIYKRNGAGEDVAYTSADLNTPYAVSE